MKGRLYDPALRRFTTADPYVTEPLNPQGLNRYSYVQNNPMNSTDPSGFDPYYMPMEYIYAQAAQAQAEAQAAAQAQAMAAAEAAAAGSAQAQAAAAQQQAEMNAALASASAAADQSAQRAMEQAQAQNVQMGDVLRAHDVAFTQPFTTPTPTPETGNGLYYGPPPVLPDNRVAQAVPIVVDGVPIPLYVPPPPSKNEQKQLDRAVRELVKTVEKLFSDLSREIHREAADIGHTVDRLFPDLLSIKAPGMPTAADGFTPPRNWDGKLVRNPNGTGYGWPDTKGNVWVPTGTGPTAHGGPHWDVQTPGGGYENVYPEGSVR